MFRPCLAQAHASASALRHHKRSPGSNQEARKADGPARVGTVGREVAALKMFLGPSGASLAAAAFHSQHAITMWWSEIEGGSGSTKREWDGAQTIDEFRKGVRARVRGVTIGGCAGVTTGGCADDRGRAPLVATRLHFASMANSNDFGSMLDAR